MNEELVIHINQRPVVEVKKRTTLIFESGYTGHRPEYLRHLMQFIQQYPSPDRKYVFVLNEKIKTKLGSLDECTEFRIRYLSFGTGFRNNIQRSFADWKLIRERILSSLSVDEIIFMDADPYLLLTATPNFKSYRLKTKGILFQPHVHFLNSDSPIFNRIKQLVKTYLFGKAAVLSNKNLTELFVLNDRKAVSQLNGNSKKLFSFLPDPVENSRFNLNNVQPVLNKFQITLQKKQLLIFGGIDKRKNLIAIIKSLNLLSPDLKFQVHLVIAGKFDTTVKKEYIAYIKSYHSEFDISYNDDFVSDEERDILFQYADLVMMPYINFFGSSGVLGHALKHNKKVIASDKGVAGAITTEYDAGIAVNPTNPVAIKDAIQKLLFSSDNTKSYNNSKFLKEHSPAQFSSTILGIKS